jgi:hypothetical protein
MTHRIVTLPGLALAVFVAAGWAQGDAAYWPGAKYNPAIPTIKQVLGYEPGERITSTTGLNTYLEALAKASPRIRLYSYAQSWEGRTLRYAVIASEDKLRRIDEIKTSWQKFADPRITKPADAKRLEASLPAIVWLGYGVHGNEISSSDAALITAYHLIASQGDPVVDKILKNDIVLLDPSQNPDGRDRFVHFFEQNVGLEPNPGQISAEHTEPWPGGRTNHYFFDLNRDWLTATQPESQGRIQMLKEWMPVVAIDLHEMGSDSTYYFTPEADPYNPFLPADLKKSMEIIGKNNAKWFDRYGFDYFTRDTYDNWYPGYGASWPMYYGGLAATYEQASSRGLVVRKSDGTLMPYRDTVRHHFVASIATLESAADNKAKFIGGMYQYRVDGIEAGAKDAVREYLMPPGHDPSATTKLASVLSGHGIEIRQAKAAFEAGGKQYPAGTYAVSLSQPQRLLVHTLLDPQTPFEEKFLKEQERRRARRLRHQIYDITAWSLPFLFNVETIGVAEPVKGDFAVVHPKAVTPGAVRGGKASVAYLIPWGTQAAGRFLAAAERENIRVWSSDEAFTIPSPSGGNQTFASGTLIVKVRDNAANIHERVAKLAESSGAEAFAVASGWTEEGPNFGSQFVQLMRKPEIAIAWDTPTGATSAGALRFVLERQYGYPTTPIRTTNLGTADLSKFNVLILPDSAGAGYGNVLGPGGIDNLKRWVSNGGTVIGIEGALALLTDLRAGLLATTAEGKAIGVSEVKPPVPGASGGAGGGATAAAGAAGPTPPPQGKLLATEADYAKAVLPASEAPDTVPGAIVKAKVDQEYWATVGVPATVYAMYTGRGIYAPLPTDKGVNAVLFEGPEQILASGYMWEENRKQLARKPMMMVSPQGRGMVIGFATDPNFRAYLDGLNVLFLNAVFRGPAHSRPAP